MEYAIALVPLQRFGGKAHRPRVSGHHRDQKGGMG